MQRIEYVIDENDQTTGVKRISIVKNPAIESDFVAFSKITRLRLAVINRQIDQKYFDDLKILFTKFSDENLVTKIMELKRAKTKSKFKVLKAYSNSSNPVHLEKLVK